MVRRRTVRIMLVVLAALSATVLAVWIIRASTFDLDVDRGTDEVALTVSTELPAATCRKALTRAFPWVRLTCEPRAADVESP